MDTVLDVSENSHAKSAVTFSVNIGPTNMGFVNYYSGSTFSPDFQNTEELSRGFLEK